MSVSYFDRLLYQVPENLLRAFHTGPIFSYESLFITGIKSCKYDIRSGSDGEIVSPNYPYHYPANTRCTWNIQAPTVKVSCLSSVGPTIDF